jgi:hypothetical protein
MEATTQLSDVVKLGKRLVTELDGDENRDTLSHWMAHHIAALIQRLDAHGAGDRLELETECRRAILELWAHRNSFRSGYRPFEKLERLLNTVEALDPANASYFYFRELGARIDKVDPLDEPAKQWLDLAKSLDRGARGLIGYCISRAAAETKDESADWVELAQKVESTLDTDVKIVRIFIQNAAALKSIVPRDERSLMKEMLQNRVESIDGHAKALAEIRGLLIDRIQEIDAGSSDQTSQNSSVATGSGRPTNAR